MFSSSVRIFFPAKQGATRFALEAQSWPCVLFSSQVSHFNFTSRVDAWVLRRHEDFVEMSLFSTHAPLAVTAQQRNG